MDSKHPPHIDPQSNASDTTIPAVRVTQVEVEAEPLESKDDFLLIPPERRLSWAGWAVALAVFLVNKKVGLIFIVLLLVFGKYPTLNLKNLSGQAGRLYRKLRS